MLCLGGYGATSNALPLLAELFQRVLFGLKPVAHLSVFLALVRKRVNPLWLEHETLWLGQAEVATYNEEVSEYVVKFAAERNRARFRERLHLDRSCSKSILTVDEYVNALRVTGCWHDVPSEARQPIADVVQADIAYNLVVLGWWEQHKL
jgi:hypothetical protein